MIVKVAVGGWGQGVLNYICVEVLLDEVNLSAPVIWDQFGIRRIGSMLFNFPKHLFFEEAMRKITCNARSASVYGDIHQEKDENDNGKNTWSNARIIRAMLDDKPECHLSNVAQSHGNVI
ncbi:hypothetical protein Pfo_016770 [Paulownia fortunei]|nr:hypothetical protein Pfo_016770 [Paulownia fortunei]